MPFFYYLVGGHSSIMYVSKEVKGWPIADVCWQGGWVEVAKCWCEQKVRKKYPTKRTFLYRHRKKLTLKKIRTFFMWDLYYEIFFPNLALFIKERNVGGGVWGNADVMVKVGTRKCWRLLIRWVGLKRSKTCWRNM